MGGTGSMMDRRSALSALLLIALALPMKSLAANFDVGPGQTYRQLHEVAPLLAPGDEVTVQGDAVYEPVMFTRPGTVDEPIVIRGVAVNGQLPRLEGGANTLQFEHSNHYVVESLEVTGGSERCVFHHAHDVTLRGLRVHGCRYHGILGADYDSGSLFVDQTEIYDTGHPGGPGINTKHAIYVATDPTAYPGSVLRVTRSYIHDNNGGSSIKSRSERTEVYHNWIETSGSQIYSLDLLGMQEFDCTRCDADVVGNVLLHLSDNPNALRFGGDGTGYGSRGRVRFVNNTAVMGTAFPPYSTIIRFQTQIDAFEAHNNIFYISRGHEGPFRLVRDTQAQWMRGDRTIVGSRNLVTLDPADYQAPSTIDYFPAGFIETVFASPADPIFADIALATPATLDLRLVAASLARNQGRVSGTASPDYSPGGVLALPALQPPTMRPAPGDFRALARPLAVDGDGDPDAGLISLGAYEWAGDAAAPVLSVEPGALDFGDLVVGDSSTDLAVTVTNTGDASLVLLAPALDGDHAGDFVLAGESGDCAGGTVLAPAGTCDIGVRFSPSDTGARTAVLVLQDSDGGAGPRVALTGSGSAADGIGAVTLDPPAIDFADRAGNAPRRERSLAIINSGSAAITISALTLEGAGAAGFGRDAGCVGVTIPVGARCTATVWFDAATEGSYTAELLVTADGVATPAPRTAAGLSGTATASSVTPRPTPVPLIGPLAALVLGAGLAGMACRARGRA